MSPFMESNLLGLYNEYSVKAKSRTYTPHGLTLVQDDMRCHAAMLYKPCRYLLLSGVVWFTLPSLASDPFNSFEFSLSTDEIRPGTASRVRRLFILSRSLSSIMRYSFRPNHLLRPKPYVHSKYREVDISKRMAGEKYSHAALFNASTACSG